MVLLFEPQAARRHLPWFLAFAIGTGLSLIGYGVACWHARERLGGSSFIGLAYGILGGLLIIFEFLYWPRREYLRGRRLGRAQDWLRAHIWLGLWTVPLLLCHSGWRFGGALSAMLLALFLVVIGSGVFGLFLQQFLPRRLLYDAPAETIQAEMESVIVQLQREASYLARALCGPTNDAGTWMEAAEEAVEPATAPVLRGAVHTEKKIQARQLQALVPRGPLGRTEPLRLFYMNEIAPYLAFGRQTGSPLADPIRAKQLFADLVTRLDDNTHGAVRYLQTLCEQRREMDTQLRLHFWLHSWLWLHFPLSVALLVLMVLHIWVAIKYW